MLRSDAGECDSGHPRVHQRSLFRSERCLHVGSTRTLPSTWFFDNAAKEIVFLPGQRNKHVEICQRVRPQAERDPFCLQRPAFANAEHAQRTTDGWDVESMGRFINLSWWMRSTLCDQSDFGTYSNIRETKLMQALTDKLPMWIDYSATCTEGEHAAYKTAARRHCMERHEFTLLAAATTFLRRCTMTKTTVLC